MPGKKTTESDKTKKEDPLKLKASQQRLAPPTKYRTYIKRLCKQHGFAPITTDAFEIPDQSVSTLIQELCERVMLMHSFLSKPKDTISPKDLQLAMRSLLCSKRANVIITDRVIKYGEDALKRYEESLKN